MTDSAFQKTAPTGREFSVLLIGPFGRGPRPYSIVRFTQTLEASLRVRRISAETLRPGPVLSARLRRSGPPRKLLEHFDKNVLFPRQMRAEASKMSRKRPPCVVHICDQGYANYAAALSRHPHVLTCHDLTELKRAQGQTIGPRAPWQTRLYWRVLVRGLSQAQLVVCPSEATRRDVVDLAGVHEDRTLVVPNGVWWPYYRMSGEKSGALLRAHLPEEVLREQFLLHVGSDIWYKNRLGVLRIFARLAQLRAGDSLHLALAGPPLSATEERLARQTGIMERVWVLTDLTDEEICALYSRAAALLFPSHMEGFGLPIIEAQRCGCPVVTSNRPPMTEVAGDAALFVDPDQPEEAGEALAAALDDLHLLREPGFVNSARFTTERMVEGYLQAYARVLSES